MLYLTPPNSVVLNEYFLKIKDKLIDNINDNSKNSFLNSEAKSFLIDELENIVKSDPVKLKELNQIFFQKLNKGLLTFKRYEFYIHCLKIKQKDRSSIQRFFLKIYLKRFRKIEQIFDYEEILSSNKPKSYWLAKKINTNTCVYCNRLYANTIEIDNGSNNDKRVARPFFDHWYAKSKFPILALSFYNLIPSCSVCNSSIKGSIEFDIDTHIHPYLRDKQNDFKFSYINKSLTDHSVIIKDYNLLSNKAKNTITDFKIQEVFDAHSDKELKDLLDLRYKYSDNYIIELFQNTFKNISISDDEIYRLVFGVETREEDYHKRSFNKFKHDIIEELRNK